MYKKVFKYLTFVCALFWLGLLCTYSSSIVGALAHELVHKSYAINPEVVIVNYDASGKATAGSFYRHSHEWVYLNGWVVEVMMQVITACSLIIVLVRGYRAGEFNNSKNLPSPPYLKCQQKQ